MPLITYWIWHRHTGSLAHREDLGGTDVFYVSHLWFQAMGWHLSGDPDAPDNEDYATQLGVNQWKRRFDDGTSPSCEVTSAPYSRSSTH
jgi:hypothetical protein